MKFKIGDIVKANESSNEIYSVTNLKNHWIGKVEDVSEDKITVITLECDKKHWIYSVLPLLEEKCFDLIEPNKCVKESK